MFLARTARQLPRSSRLAIQARYTLASRFYASQATAQQPPPLPASSSDSSPNSSSASDVPNTAPASRPAAGAPKASERELSDLISKMMPNRGNRSARPPRPTHPTRLSSADEVAAELDRLSSNPVTRRQGQLVDGLSDGRMLDYDVLEIGQRAPKLPPLNPPVRCNAYIGRAENVGRGVTLARAFDKLSMKLAINKVRADTKKQKFHERPGLRRKRLKSQRWRLKFKRAFKADVSKVQRMVKQGW